MATRYQHSTDRSGSVTSTKVTNTSTGKSYTKTYGRRSSGGSSSRVPTVKKKYVDKFGVIRVEGGTGYNPTAYAQSLKSGSVSKSGLPTVFKANTSGKIGKGENAVFYNNLTDSFLSLF